MALYALSIKLKTLQPLRKSQKVKRCYLTFARPYPKARIGPIRPGVGGAA